MCREFGLSEFEDGVEALFKLPQTGTLREYISEVGPILLKSCYVGGLKRELKFDVKLLKPKTVCEAIATDIQLDFKFQELKEGSYKPANPTLPKIQLPNTTVTTPYVPRLHNYPIKKLSPAEIQLKRENGGCWFCNDKWVKGLKCGLKQLLMLVRLLLKPLLNSNKCNLVNVPFMVPLHTQLLKL